MFDKSGRYYIGDLSALLTPEEVMHTKQFKDGFCSLPDGTTIYKKTVDNGVFRTNKGNLLSVSIGLIGVVFLAPKYHTNNYIRNINLYGMASFFNAPFNVEVSNTNGDFIVGKGDEVVIVDLNSDGLFGGEIDTTPYIDVEPKMIQQFADPE